MKTGTLFIVDYDKKELTWHTCILFDNGFTNVFNVDCIQFRNRNSLAENEVFFGFDQKKELEKFLKAVKEKMNKKRMVMDKNLNTLHFRNIGVDFPVGNFATLCTEDNVYVTDKWCGDILYSLGVCMQK